MKCPKCGFEVYPSPNSDLTMEIHLLKHILQPISEYCDRKNREDIAVLKSEVRMAREWLESEKGKAKA